MYTMSGNHQMNGRNWFYIYITYIPSVPIVKLICLQRHAISQAIAINFRPIQILRFVKLTWFNHTDLDPKHKLVVKYKL